MSQGVSSALIGERRQRLVLGEAETDNVVSGASDEAVMMLWVGLCPRPSAEASGESEVHPRPLCVRPRMKRGDRLVCSHDLLEA
jgi:hypothetical protein